MKSDVSRAKNSTTYLVGKCEVKLSPQARQREGFEFLVDETVKF